MKLEKLFEKGQEFVGSKGLIFFGDDLILVYQRDGNTDFYPFYLDLPGGGRESDETPFETFQRELDEEFGLKVKASDVIYAKTHPAIQDPTKTGYFIVTRLREDIKKADPFWKRRAGLSANTSGTILIK